MWRNIIGIGVVGSISMLALTLHLLTDWDKKRKAYFTAHLACEVLYDQHLATKRREQDCTPHPTMHGVCVYSLTPEEQFQISQLSSCAEAAKLYDELPFFMHH